MGELRCGWGCFHGKRLLKRFGVWGQGLLAAVPVLVPLSAELYCAIPFSDAAGGMHVYRAAPFLCQRTVRLSSL